MKIAQVVSSKKFGCGVSTFDRSFRKEIAKLRHKITYFPPKDEEIYEKTPRIGWILKFVNFAEQVEELKKFDIVLASDIVPITLVRKNLPLVIVFHCTPKAQEQYVPEDFKQVIEPFVLEQYFKEVAKVGIPPEKESLKMFDNIVIGTSYIAQNCKNLIAVSQREKAEFINYYHIPARNIKVIENGIEKFWFDKTKCPKCEKIVASWDKTKPTLIWLTRITKATTLNTIIKGVDRGLSVMKHVGNKVNKVVISLTDKIVAEKFKKIFDEIGVKFIIDHPREHIPHILQKADICIQPSRYESFGYALAEAMASGVACIAFPTGFVPDAITDRKNAIVVNNTGEMINAVNDLADDKKLREKIRKKGKETIAKRYTIERMAKEYVEYFKKVLQK